MIFTPYRLRDYEPEDLDAVVALVNELADSERSITVRPKAYFQWLSLDRPGAETVGPFVVESESTIVGFAVCLPTGEILDLAVSPDHDVATVTRLLIEAVERGSTDAGARTMMVNTASERRDLAAVLETMGYSSRPLSNLYLSIMDPRALLGVLLEHAPRKLLGSFRLSITSPYPHLSWNLAIDGPDVAEVDRKAPIAVSVDAQRFAKIVFLDKSPFVSFLTGQLRIRPLTAAPRILRLLDSIQLDQAFSFSRSQVL